MYVRPHFQERNKPLTSAVEEKFGSGSLKRRRDDDSEDESSSSSEDEDDIGVLATEDLDKEIFATLAAIKNKDPRVYDGKTSFYTPIEASAPATATDSKKEKPMFLRDYHRENLLGGNADEEEVDDQPQTYVQQQANLKDTVVKEMHAVAAADGEDDGDEDEGFLVRKPSENKEKKGKEAGDIPDPALADKDPEEFLNKFLASRAWTKTTGSAYVPIESDDSEDDAIADEFEFNYNMRFEDPDAAARAKLVSYGRDAVNANSVRREEKSRRKKAREEKLRKKEDEKAQRELERGRLKKLKTEELMRKFQMVKEAADLSEADGEAEAEMLHKLLEGDFSDGEWDSWMRERFGDKYYDTKGRPKKPTFDDDIDINDIVPDFEDDAVNEDEEYDDEEGGIKLNAEDEEMEDAEDAAEEKPAKKKSKKELLKEKQAKKAKERSTRRKVERFVEENFDFDSELPGSKTSGFRYRETTPETYGLDMLDILAADDADLNAYAGLKKLAPFRDPAKKQKDKKRYAKKKLLKQWRKEVFGDAKGVQMPPDWKPQGLKSEERVAGKVDITENGDGGRKRKRRRKNNDKA